MSGQTDSYDYVVVGAGTAGCAVSTRLSADPDRSVLVLEAGEPDHDRSIHVPAEVGNLFKSSVDWEYYTEPQEELHGRELYWPRGKTLGGSSSINAMIHIRGHPGDFDEWAELGNDGWSYEELLPYFKRSENSQTHRTTYHGVGGPLNVTELESPYHLSQVFVDAGIAAGYSRNYDFNGREQAGVGLYQVTQKDGERHSAADAYLKPALLERSNLTARTGAQVTELLFDGDRVVGVEYDDGDGRQTVHAEEEVVLSAGAINTPQLLLLSGIGPAEHLRSHDVDVAVDLPGVGRNLQDHLLVAVNYSCTGTTTRDDTGTLDDVVEYHAQGSGRLSSNGGEAGGFLRSDPSLDRPDVQFHFGPGYFMRHGFENPDEGHGFYVAATQVRPESRGRIELRSDDPFDEPAIDPRYLTEREDVDTMVEGVRRAREVAQAEPFDEYRGEEVWPGEDVESDEAIAEQVREHAQTIYHPVGTCKMGDGESAVVDDRLRVHGVSGLRVVDASVMPRIVGGNTNAATLAIAEKAADLIAEDE
ncbi:GMC family oxidoreductase [Halobellus litoreus]|uniref:GMC family oxidoreductase n=1 Tax=Halobellus litoreus TaxID=755310 RepID=A0ABD6DSI6_9EURY|nr:choline dehydrogenase [Halobellus litoreus]